MNKVELILVHQQAMGECRLCPEMIPPVILGQPVQSEILLIGQAPGDREGALGRPFAWTAGKTMFKWFESIGITGSRFICQPYAGVFPEKIRKAVIVCRIKKK